MLCTLYSEYTWYVHRHESDKQAFTFFVKNRSKENEQEMKEYEFSFNNHHYHLTDSNHKMQLL